MKITETSKRPVPPPRFFHLEVTEQELRMIKYCIGKVPCHKVREATGVNSEGYYNEMVDILGDKI